MILNLKIKALLFSFCLATTSLAVAQTKELYKDYERSAA